MRLLRLYLGEHRVLRQLDIRFDALQKQLTKKDEPYHLDFLVGVNGSGKSTVLRVIAHILQNVQTRVIEIPFILEFWLSSEKQKVRICNIHPVEKSPLGSYFVSTSNSLDGEYEPLEPTPENMIENVPSNLMPKSVIAYTTGDEESWILDSNAETFERSSVEILEKETTVEERALRELPGWPSFEAESGPASSGDFVLIPKAHLPLVALGGLLVDLASPGEAKDRPLYNIFQEAEIKAFSGFSLKFDLRSAGSIERDAIRDRFARIATRAVRNGGEYRLVFDLSQPGIAERLLQQNGSGLDLFNYLSRYYEAGSAKNELLTEICLFFERCPEKIKGEDGEEIEKIPHLHTWDWLSDGERSFLGRMCLFLLLGDTESLILLDEPEVHFNDFWKRHIVRLLDDIIQRKNGNLAEDQRTVSHILIATHSSIALTDVQPDDILILEREGLYTGTTRMPKIKTFGADPSEIMVHVFGAPYATGEYSVTKIDQWLIDAQGKDDPRERERFLKQKLQSVAPGYWAYRIRREMMGIQQQ